MTGVIGDRNAARHGLGAALDDQIGQALSGRAHGEAIHAVQAGAQHAAQAGGTERKRRKEAILNGFVIAPDGF